MKQLAKILIALLIIIITFIVLDVIFGQIASKELITGKSKQEYFFNVPDTSRIAFFGSSRAKHHYDTPFITDSLGISAINAGEDGRGLSYHLPIIKKYLSRNSPTLIVLDVLPTMDGNWNDRITLLYPYISSNPEILEAALLVDSNNKFYLKSNFYRHNGNLISEVKSKRNPYDPGSLGFDPIPPIISDSIIPEKNDSVNFSADQIEEKVLREILDLCKEKNINIIGIISPTYGTGFKKSQPEEIFREYGFHFIDNRNFRLALAPEKYFLDGSHLNKYGAQEYTKFIMHQICDSLNLIPKSK